MPALCQGRLREFRSCCTFPAREHTSCLTFILLQVIVAMTRKQESAQPALDAVKESGGDAVWKHCDATDEAAIKAAFEGLGVVDVLIYNVSATFASIMTNSMDVGWELLLSTIKCQAVGTVS